MRSLVSKILQDIGYYDIKAAIRKRQQIRQYRREDIAFKQDLDAKISRISERLLPLVGKNTNITVSLTTHGDRVANMAPYAVMGILQQSALPNRIVLNIDKEKWNQENLPNHIIQLQKAGLEVNFCEDIGPHTKLLPTMQKYPDDIIITIDDDVYYDPNMIKALMEVAKATNFKCIVCNDCVCIERDEEGHILPYSKWKPYSGVQKRGLVPLGFRGVLYPPHLFSKEIFNQSIYRSICRGADDIWFGLMELREGIPVMCINSPERRIRDIDRLNEYFAEGSDALHFVNNAGGKNDVQSRAVVEYYKLNAE